VNETGDESRGSGAAASPDRPRGRWRPTTSIALVAACPLVLALAAFYPHQLAGAPLPRPQGDAAFYAYQLMRAAECRGHWWRVADDPRVGHPYPTEFAKHPGLYEGVDLMLLAALSAGAFGAAGGYHLAVLTVLAANGWIAAWIVWRFTRKPLWAAASASLITLNQSVAVRILGHLHLFKFCWALLAVWAFVVFLERPSRRRGVLLGLAAALMLQSSFYLGFLLLLGLGTWYLFEIVSGRVQRRDVGAVVAASAAFVLVGGALCFPVWARSSAIAGSGQYFHRGWHETWSYGSELWKYLVPRGSALERGYFREVRLRATPPLMDEGWNFPGYTVWLGVCFAGVCLVRRPPIEPMTRRFVTVVLGLMAIWTVVSLSGGPASLLYFVMPSFRCYGRAGLLVVAAGSVLAPIAVSEVLRTRRRPLVRASLTLGVLALVASDAWRAASTFPGWPKQSQPPYWVEHLRRQPADTRLAVFALPENQKPVGWWGYRSLEWLPLHRHATLNGGDFALFEGDLRLLGGSYERINPAGLGFVASLGYDAFAFHRDYLVANPWIAGWPGLERIDERGEWLVARAGPRIARFPTRPLEELLALHRDEPKPIEAPPGCWITGSWPVSEDTIAAGADWALLAWTDERGREISDRKPAFYQHVYGPSLPAYTVRTPARPGNYRLVVLDRAGRRRATKSHRIVADLAVSQPALPAHVPGVTVHPLVVTPAAAGRRISSLNLTLLNTSSWYLLSQVFREHVDAVARTHPGLRSQWAEANAGAAVLRISPAGPESGNPADVREIALPRDLPPGGRLDLAVPVDRLPPDWANRPLQVEPSFARVGHLEASPQAALLKLSSDGPAPEVARSRAAFEERTLGPR
jgi:hypothetical protein